MERILISNLLDTEKTIAKDIFSDKEYPFEILAELSDFIIKLGKTLSKDKFEEVKPNVWISKSATVFNSAYIAGPCIIDEDAEVRHCAFIRGSVIIGKGSVVGNSTEVKNSLIFDSVQIPHYNYVGDSVLGYKSHLGAGSITSNVKSDKSNVVIKVHEKALKTGRKKVGAIVGDFVEVGCGSVLNPGTVIGRNSNVYPLSSVRGYVDENSIYKAKGEIVLKK